MIAIVNVRSIFTAPVSQLVEPKHSQICTDLCFANVPNIVLWYKAKEAHDFEMEVSYNDVQLSNYSLPSLPMAIWYLAEVVNLHE